MGVIMHPEKKYDVIVIGGGIVGLTFALALAQDTALSIAVIEAHTFTDTWNEASYFPRVSAITLTSKKILQNIHIWESIAKKRLSPFKQIKIWQAQEVRESLQFSADDIQKNCLGYIVENNLLQETLLAALRQSERIDFLKEKVTHYVCDDDQITLMLESGDKLQAKLAIGADGANSWLRKYAHIDVDQHDYAETALVATIQTEKPHAEIARQAFLNTGPLGMLPLSEPNLISIVWSQPKALAESLIQATPDEFKAAFSEASANVLGEVIAVQNKKLFPLKKLNAKSYIGNRIALLGDAAHVVHPLAGQGVNMGLLDAAALHDVMLTAIAQNKDFSQVAVLRRYERWRKADNYWLMSGIDLIKAMFANQHPIIKHSVTLGMRVMNGATFLKNIFTAHAVGQRSHLPSLAKARLPF